MYWYNYYFFFLMLTHVLGVYLKFIDFIYTFQHRYFIAYRHYNQLELPTFQPIFRCFLSSFLKLRGWAPSHLRPFSTSTWGRPKPISLPLPSEREYGTEISPPSSLLSDVDKPLKRPLEQPLLSEMPSAVQRFADIPFSPHAGPILKLQGSN